MTDGAATMVEGKFLNQQPHFAASSDYRKKAEPNPFFSRIQTLFLIFVVDFLFFSRSMMITIYL
ncbi:hypothetical protein Hdeb2414_s0001g00009361 [Helianthus debilis subsp. tardiflorus]